jgi:hypothetical protein
MKSISTGLFALAVLIYSCGGSAETPGTASSTTEAPAEATAPTENNTQPEEENTTEDLELARQSAAVTEEPFEERLTEGPVTFIVKAPNTMPNSFTLNTEGMSVRNEETTVDVEGQVVRASLADLNQDSYPEVYIITRREDGTENVYAFASYRNRSYGQIYMAEARAYTAQRGYEGGDTYELTETKLVCKFPITQDGQRTDEAQTVKYTLKKGETSYRLEPVE